MRLACVRVCEECLFFCALRTRSPWGSEEVADALELITQLFWGWSPGPLREEQVLLTMESSLQPPVCWGGQS